LLTVDIYRDENIYTDDAGGDRPAFRRLVNAAGEMETALTIRQLAGVEHALHPAGGSGLTLHGWAARYSPRDAATGSPATLFDAATGRIDAAVARAWARFDLTRLVTSDWDRYGPIVMERIRLNCGEADSFFLNAAMQRFKESVEVRAAREGGWRGPGYVRVVAGAAHEDLMPRIFQRLNEEMRAHLTAHGLQE
jgi:hypothetical protein